MLRQATVVIGLMISAELIAVGSTNTNPPAVSGERSRVIVERADRMLGREVQDATGKRLGQVSDLVVDLDCGRVLYAVVLSRGFAGIGNRSVGVPAGMIRTQGSDWRIPVDQQKFKGAPQVKREQLAHPEDPAFVISVYKYFGQPMWWGASDVQFNNVHKLSELIGMQVKDLADKKIGEVNNLAIDTASGRVICVIVSATADGGRYALPPNSLTPGADRQNLSTSIDPDKLAAAPRFEKDQWPDMTDPAWTSKLYQYFGKQAYFDSGELRMTGRTNKPPRIYHEPDEPKKWGNRE
jgi:sporulation protein YlmC with PRC-barrel domain